MDISAEVAAIQAASQGSELRQPLVGALNKLNSGSLPAVTASDAGKILKVGANGWEVGEKSGYMPVPSATMQITENNTYDVTNYSSAVVNVSGGSSTLVSKTITENGTYDPADDNADGYSGVIVNVSGGGGGRVGNTYFGSGAPSSNIGNDGDVYVRAYHFNNNINFVEYLDSHVDGPYIDTGIKGKQTLEMEAVFLWRNQSYIIGSRYSTSYNQFVITGMSNTNFNVDRGSERKQFTGSTVGLTYGSSIAKIKIKPCSVSINNTFVSGYSTSNPQDGFQTPYNIILFGINSNGTINARSQRIYRCTFRDNGIIIADFLPALDNDSVPCMYDNVSGQFFYDASGNNDFYYGDPITPEDPEPEIYRKVNGSWDAIKY